ncbi:MAG TPA: hypothetical protein GX401_08750 [Clostridiales bacterium]|nr:hypothetical protein [Clostridiales bacterium]
MKKVYFLISVIICFLLVGCNNSVELSSSNTTDTATNNSSQPDVTATANELSILSDTPDFQTMVKSIYVCHYSMGSINHEYEIDFSHNKFYEFYSEDNSDNSDRNKSKKNNGYQEVTDLEAESVDVFFQQAMFYGFFDWEDEYVNESVVDDNDWVIEIKYNDGKKREITGSNAYPDTWDDMIPVFIDLTGVNVLEINAKDYSEELGEKYSPVFW